MSRKAKGRKEEFPMAKHGKEMRAKGKRALKAGRIPKGRY